MWSPRLPNAHGAPESTSAGCCPQTCLQGALAALLSPEMQRDPSTPALLCSPPALAPWSPLTLTAEGAVGPWG